MSKEYFKFPLHYLAMTTNFSSSHRGLDFGWNSKYGGANVPIYSATSGVVVLAEYWSGAGNTIMIRYDSPEKDYSIFTLYKHLSKMVVKKNDVVEMYQQIGNMGSTGTQSTGAHLHFDVVKTPYQYNYQQSDSDRAKYSVNPYSWCYMYEDQVVNTETSKLVTKVLGTSKKVERDTTKNQIEVIGYQLRVRKGAGTNQTILGYIDYGIYDYLETKTSNGYTWYNLGFGWIAGVSGDVKVYPKENEIPDVSKTIEELEKTIEELTKKLDSYSNLKTFEVKTGGYYYIKLSQGEKILKN